MMKFWLNLEVNCMNTHDKDIDLLWVVPACLVAGFCLMVALRLLVVS